MTILKSSPGEFGSVDTSLGRRSIGWTARTGGSALYVALLALVGVGAPLLYLDQPLHVDESTFLVVGRELASGAALYEDVIDHKGPAIFLVAAFAEGFGAPSYVVLRSLVAGAHLATALVVLALGRRLRDATTGMVASLLFLVGAYLPHFDGFYGLTEPFALPLLALSALLLVDGRPLSSRTFVAGVCGGVAALFNQTALLFSVVVVVYALSGLRYPESRTSRFVRRAVVRVAVVAAGFALPPALALGYAATQGTLAAMLRFAVVVPVTMYDPAFSLKGHLIALGTYAPVWGLAALAAVGGTVAYLRGRRTGGAVRLLVPWLLVLGYPGMSAFDGDHKLLFAFPPAALLAAVALRDLWATRATAATDGGTVSAGPALGSRRRHGVRLLFGALLVASVVATGLNGVLVAGMLSDSVETQRAEARAVSEHVPEGATAYTLPFRNHLLYLSDLEPAHTFVGLPYAEPLADRIVRDLERERVGYVVVPRDRVSDDGEEYLAHGYYYDTQSRIFDYVDERYRLVATTESFAVYERIERSGRAAATGSTHDASTDRRGLADTSRSASRGSVGTARPAV